VNIPRILEYSIIKVIRIFKMFLEVHERDYFLKYFLFKNILKYFFIYKHIKFKNKKLF